ncbi:MAG: class I tRNA ligase family protein [Evtepia sp.]
MRCSDEDLQAAEPELPEVPQHRPVLPGQPERLRPRQPGGTRRHAGAGQVGHHPPQRLSSRSASQGYDDYDFNVVTHAVNDFCVVEMSNFYLDIIKDRLYCDEAEDSPGPPLRPDRPVPDPGHHDQDHGPRAVLHRR